jgi:cytochrome c-type biogenesis protein CcmH/NrfF
MAVRLRDWIFGFLVEHLVWIFPLVMLLVILTWPRLRRRQPTEHLDSRRPDTLDQRGQARRAA